jgi:pyruvate dehydrogenase E2 component (dihydrolipoamide acetyltransferase)
MTETSLSKPPENRIPLTRIQKLIGRRMSQSKQSKPCFYIESKADVTELMGLRPALKKSLSIKVTTNAFFIRALALAVRKYPVIVGRLEGDNIKLADAINVGFAVNAPQGVVVPVIRDADKKTLAQIAILEQSLTEKARSNKLTLQDMEAETVALSNLGAYDVDSFIGIVPPSASTILAVGNVIRTVCPVDGKPTVRKVASLTLAVDHRIINGTYAAKFLNFIAEQLENPQQLV